MFIYSKEKELHQHIVDNFLDFFDFNYLSSEFTVDSGRIDIIGTKDNVVYVVELKRDIVNEKTIEQLSSYLMDVQFLYPGKEVIGIAAAPDIKEGLEIPFSNIELMKLDNVELNSRAMKRLVTFKIDENIIDRLRILSKETHIPQTRLTKLALDEFITKKEKEMK